MVVTHQYFTVSISSIFGPTTRWMSFLIQLNLSHLSWVVPLGCLRDVVHEVELAGGGLGHLPAGGELPEHLVLRPPHVVALLPLVVQLQRLVRLKTDPQLFLLSSQSINICKYIFGIKSRDGGVSEITFDQLCRRNWDLCKRKLEAGGCFGLDSLPIIIALLAVSQRKLIHSVLELGFKSNLNVYKGISGNVPVT